MKQMEDRAFDQELYEKSWDWFGEIILLDDVERITSSLNKTQFDAKADAYFEKYNTAYQSQIDKFFRKKKMKILLTQKAPLVLRMIAIIIGVFTIAVSIAAASSTTIRTYLVKLIIQSTPEYTMLQIQEEPDSSIDVPDEWTGKYYPSIIPKGLVIDQVLCDSPDNKEITFCDPGSRKVMFSFSEIKSGVTKLDTEEASCQDILIHGIAGKAVIKDGSKQLYWFDGETLFIIYTQNNTITEMITIAEGIRRIR